MDLPFDYANCVLQRVTRLQHSNKTYASMSEEDMNESMEHPEHGDHNVAAVLSYLLNMATTTFPLYSPISSLVM